jgi:energy-coupling factor transporter ATP-binding protein EcfA2
MSSSIFNLKGIINIYGPSGYGKTTFFKSIKHIDIDHEIFKSKESATNFFDLVFYSKLPVVLDNFEFVENMPGVKDIIPLKYAPLYIISQKPIEEFTQRYEFPKPDFPIRKYEGDVFLDCKEYVAELIKTREPLKYIDRYLCEHGNTIGIIHENYPDYCTDMVKVSMSLSDADVIDTYIYSEISWDMMPFFNVSACLIPALYIHSEKCALRAGSIWTKTNNMLMKKGRLKKLRMHRDCIHILALKVNFGEKIPITSSYDLDTINQLSFTKIKAKIIQTLKKGCVKS